MSKDCYILSFKPTGITTSPEIHDTGAAISKNGKIVAAVEEERFVRIKHAVGMFPTNSIRYCLQEAGIDFSDLNSIVIPNDPDLLRRDAFDIKNMRRPFYRYKIIKTFREESSVVGSVFNRLIDKEKYRQRLVTFLRYFYGDQKYPPIHFLGHHLCHAASCFYPSGFEDAVIITIDGIGDFDSTVIWSWDGKNIKRELSWKVDNSLGYFYGAFTVFLGYRFCNGECKVMGLAPYGEKNSDIFDVFDEIIKTDLNGYDVSEISIPMMFGYMVGIKRIEQLFGIKRRLVHEPFTKEHKDLAYAAQYYLEKIVTNLICQAIELTGCRNVCLAGGVALNCKVNKRIMELPEVKNLFIQPISSDAGLTLGAVLEMSHRKGFDVHYTMKHTYLGPYYENSFIEKLLEERKIVFSKLTSLKPIAKALAEGKFVGWFQGRMEMGPRALGNRSILADPRRKDIADRLNDFVKHREKWRPFAPSILEEYADEYLKKYSTAPFMIKTFDVNEKHQKFIGGVIHPADKTTRPHVVCKDVNPRFYELIEEYRKITGIPMILNTSFNDHGEPIVCSPQDALHVFYGTGLDILVMEDYVIKK